MQTRPASGELVWLGGREFYRVESFDALAPFLMSLASGSDLWMFIASTGGLTAGRSNPDGSLFPYETVDRLYDAHHHSGPVTMVWVANDSGHGTLWEPFAQDSPTKRSVERSLYKGALGNEIAFEETNHDAGLSFRYTWSPSEMGWVRTCRLENRSTHPVQVRVLDGLRNVLSFGAPLKLYQTSSSLIDAYRRVDLDAETGLAVFSLTSEIIDRAEPAESLRANVVWCSGLPEGQVALDGTGVDVFRRGGEPSFEPVLTGERGNYLRVARLPLGPGEVRTWRLIADAGRGHADVANLRRLLLSGVDVERRIEASIQSDAEGLWNIVAGADGAQRTRDGLASVHHYANTMFNCMRGGAFIDGYRCPTSDVAAFFEERNRPVAARVAQHLRVFGTDVSLSELLEFGGGQDDPDVSRLALEYLPLHFGRRHGDPSRPWNRFEIKARTSDGRPRLHYEGNWRDVFQNWEALAYSYPLYLTNMVAKFVNASTVDGFNPYRLTRDGIDWETESPEDPWSNIGYWGDHQLIYLLKLLEALSRFQPGVLETLLDREIFSYADVPYRIVAFEQLVADPHSTIRYDHELAATIDDRVEKLGADGKLVQDRDGSVYHVNLLEKLLVPVLSKLSNLILGAGIWMNTQRPEWNDANNALVGYGVSTVTLCYLRRYLTFLQELTDSLRVPTARLSHEVAQWLAEVHDALEEADLEDSSVAAIEHHRMRLLESLGRSFERYRKGVYESGFSRKTAIEVSSVRALCGSALRVVDRSLRHCRRDDGLYHSYSVLEFSGNGADPGGRGVRVSPLFEMLEGQVAALSSGLLGPEEAIETLESLFWSRMYRADQNSFMLYPERELPSFWERNLVPSTLVQRVPLLQEMIRRGERRVLLRDALGTYRFHPDFRNARDLAAALDRLATSPEWTESVEKDRSAVLHAFEQVFRHREFTGRSGTMYGYEGIGCIYWHMVAKLLLAVQEQVLSAVFSGSSEATVSRLVELYYQIRKGLGFEKSVTEFGAIPIDPYSHTPRRRGAQQPGMTGQVKEEILTRLGELGVRIASGRVTFAPVLLREEEFFEEPTAFRYLDVLGVDQELSLGSGELAFTLAQVPVVYSLTDAVPSVEVILGDGDAIQAAGLDLDPRMSASLFAREGRVRSIRVSIPRSFVVQRTTESRRSHSPLPVRRT